MADNPHTGHRRRMLDKFGRFGANVFEDHELLEMLLYFAVRQGDTNPTAHRLIAHFGSLHAVMEASVEQLVQVEGIGPRSAELLTLVFALYGRYAADVQRMEQHSVRLNTRERIGEYFLAQLADEKEEVLLAAYVDGAGRVLKCEEIARGGHAQVAIDPYKIASGALFCQAAGVIIAHNHPNGVPVPSDEDIRATDQLELALRGLHLELVEHCIVARRRYSLLCSLRCGNRLKKR